MTDLEKAARQTLEAWQNPQGMPEMCKAMDALRRALEQPAQCPGCEGNPSPENNPCAVCGKPARQGPVTWLHVIPGGRNTDKWDSARVADYNKGWNDYRKAAKTALENLAKEQTPAAVYRGHREIPEGTKEFWGMADKPLPVGTLLYTRPQAREWVGLTDEEIDEMERIQRREFGQLCDAEDLRMLARAVETKLREKNT